MIVNLSLERSARFIVNTAINDERLFVVNTGEQKPYFEEINNIKLKSTSMLGGSKEQLDMAKRTCLLVARRWWRIDKM